MLGKLNSYALLNVAGKSGAIRPGSLTDEHSPHGHQRLRVPMGKNPSSRLLLLLLSPDHMQLLQIAFRQLACRHEWFCTPQIFQKMNILSSKC